MTTLTTRQAAAYLAVTPRLLVRWRRDRVGPPWFRLPNTLAVRYRRESLDQWMSERETIGLPVRGRKLRAV